MRRLAVAYALLTVVAACSGDDGDFSAVPELSEASPESIADLLAESNRPVVLNVWASWCIPCRSEAPLLDRAASEYIDRVAFVGINVRNDQTNARRFIAEFFPDAPIVHFVDEHNRIPVALGGNLGVPQTFFYATGGELVALQPSVIDERTLALQINEILARSR